LNRSWCWLSGGVCVRVDRMSWELRVLSDKQIPFTLIHLNSILRSIQTVSSVFHLCFVDRICHSNSIGQSWMEWVFLINHCRYWLRLLCNTFSLVRCDVNSWILVCWKVDFLCQPKLNFHPSLPFHNGECTLKILDHCASHEADITAIACMSDSLISWDHNWLICFSPFEQFREIENAANLSGEHTEPINSL
jgi:hypothetical protein